MQPTQDELPSPEQDFEWPRQAIQERNWSEAARRWAVLRRAYPNHPATWFQGAIAHMETGELDQAEQLLTHARQQFPNHPNSLLECATLAIRRQQWDLAEDLLAKARERHADLLPTWMKSADLAEAMGDLNKAQTYYQRACQCAPDVPAPYIRYAELAMRAEHWEEALHRWEVVRDRFPDHAAGYHRAAEAARNLGRSREARQLLLTHQYGPDVLDADQQPQSLSKPNKGHTSKKRLLELIWTKAIFNLRSEVHRNYLSYGWWVLEPLLHMAVYYIVFGHLLQHGGKDYPVFLLTGLVPWMWFMKAVGGSSSSIIAGQHLMLQVGLPSIVFPLVSILQATLKQIPVLVLLLGFLWLQGYKPDYHWIALIPVVIVQALLTIAFGCAVAAVIPFVRDLAHLVPTGLTFVMFLSGIFYDYRNIAPQWQDPFLMNPIAFLIKCYREIFMEGVAPDLSILMWWGIGSTAACLLLLVAYGRLRYVYPRIVLE